MRREIMPVALRGEETFSDSIRWQELAKEHNVRLPLWRMPITTGGMRRFLKKINVPVDQYLSDNAELTLKVFGKKNPNWPLRAWAGLQLENIGFTPFGLEEEEINA